MFLYTKVSIEDDCMISEWQVSHLHLYFLASGCVKNDLPFMFSGEGLSHVSLQTKFLTYPTGTSCIHLAIRSSSQLNDMPFGPVSGVG